MARKATMVSLYQRGVWPRKFCQKAFAVLILFSLNQIPPVGCRRGPPRPGDCAFWGA